MAKLAVRSKSTHKLRQPRKEDVSVAHEIEAVRARAVLPEGDYEWSHTPKNAGSPYTASPGFQVLRPKTANAAMERRRMELMATGSPIGVTEGKDTFNFPTPLKRTPQAQLTPLMSRYATDDMLRSSTPDTIGMAIGSPSHIAHFESPLIPSSAKGRMYAPSRDILTPLSTPGPSMLSQESKAEKSDSGEAPRPKLSRWKSLGGLFARKPSNVEKSPKEPTTPGLGLQGYHTWEHESPPRKRAGTETRPHTSKGKSSRIAIGRSQTAPTGRRTPGSPVPPPKDLLDVEIPNTKMDRYSVMFNGILPVQPGGGGLLARRQSRRDNAKPSAVTSLESLDVPPVPKRRNTTHSPSASPSYRLLVFPPERHHSPKTPGRSGSLLHRPRPLKRSNTAPGALSPALHGKFSPLSPMSEVSETTMISPSGMSTEAESFERESLSQGRGSLDRTPTPSEPSTPTTPTDGHSVHSYNPFHDRTASASWERILEPSWEMITIGKMLEPGDRFSGATAQVAVHDETSPIEKSPQRPWHPLRMNSQLGKNGSKPSTRTEVPQVQIARSMSVTKAHGARPMLKPRVVEAKMGEKLVERNILTPTLVEVVHLGAAGKGHTPKRSVCGIVETA